MYDLKNFGKRIEESRKRKNMTQENLAEKLGVTNQAVSKWENGLCYPDIELIPTLCAIFEISLDDIFGKAKKNTSGIEFPEKYKGADFVCSFANVACYSDKAVEKAEGSTVTFADGSLAELSSRRIVNRGEGKIFLKTMDDTFIAEHIITDDSKKPDKTRLDLEYGKVGDLECAIPNGNCIIEKSAEEKTAIYAEGYPEFIDLLEFEYKESERKLRLKHDQQKRNKINNEMNKWDISKNNIKISVAYDGERLNSLGLSIDGAGKIKLGAPSANAGLSINGSGNIEAPVSFGNLGIAINGSGDINFNEAENCGASINGSGRIGAKKVGNLGASINGSGDFDMDKVTQKVKISIHGSGDVNIKGGEVETFDVYLENGEVNAKGVTTNTAKIEIPNHGKVEIGRVKVESIERCGDHADVIIHKRG